MSKGVWYAVTAYVTWGLSPIYWKQLEQLPPPALIAYRVLWSLAILGVLLLCRPRYRFGWKQATRRIARVYAIAALLICVNWLTYVWAVTAGFIVEASLGYFITPLVTVGLGVVVLGERLRLGQWLAVALAAIGLVSLTTALGTLPWIAFVLAGSFGVYGLVKKQAPLGAVQGLTAETGMLLLPAVVWLLWAPSSAGPTTAPTPATWLLLAGSGFLTVGPLVLFAASVQRIPLAHMGLLQYVAPTIQFLLGVLLYDEPFGRPQLVGYGLVWAALILFAAEGLYARRTLSMPPFRT
ncbi:MAG: protein RarD [Acidobacteria bacterium]|nr:protein RarD [Acidobacteriota bacterium]